MSQSSSKSEYCVSCHTTVHTDIGSHWEANKSCSPPALTTQQRAIVHGLLFTTGRIHQANGQRGARIQFQTQNESLVNWLACAFGVLTATVERQGDKWVWESHSAQAFTQFTENWQTERGKPYVPEAVDITPETLRTVYAVVGMIRSPNDNPRPVFGVNGCNASADDFETLTRHFYPMQFEMGGGNVEVYLNQTEDFFQYVGSPVPGCDNAWLDGDTATSASKEACPHCLREYKYLETHWDAGSTCTPPMISWRQHGLVEGILLGGGNLEPAKTRYRLIVTRDSPRLLKALDDTFGVLSAGVQETATGFRWESKGSVEFGRFVRWLDEDGEVSVPTDLHHTSEMLRVAYAMSGTFDEGCPKFSFIPDIDSEGFPEKFFEEFDPMVVSESIVLRDVSGFFGYVGWVPLPGGEDAWPNTS